MPTILRRFRLGEIGAGISFDKEAAGDALQFFNSDKISFVENFIHKNSPTSEAAIITVAAHPIT